MQKNEHNGGFVVASQWGNRAFVRYENNKRNNGAFVS